jgi:hypothetical protein
MTKQRFNACVETAGVYRLYAQLGSSTQCQLDGGPDGYGRGVMSGTGTANMAEA